MKAAATCIAFFFFTNLRTCQINETVKGSQHSVASELGPATAHSEQHVALTVHKNRQLLHGVFVSDSNNPFWRFVAAALCTRDL